MTIRTTRTKPRRTGMCMGHKRERLKGDAKTKRREEIFRRAGGMCEEIIRCKLPECNVGSRCYHVYRCPNRATEWSHLRHGANKCDHMNCGIASCHECHVKRHNAGGKPCPKKETA